MFVCEKYCFQESLKTGERKTVMCFDLERPQPLTPETSDWSQKRNVTEQMNKEVVSVPCREIDDVVKIVYAV